MRFSCCMYYFQFPPEHSSIRNRKQRNENEKYSGRRHAVEYDSQLEALLFHFAFFLFNSSVLFSSPSHRSEDVKQTFHSTLTNEWTSFAAIKDRSVRGALSPANGIEFDISYHQQTYSTYEGTSHCIQRKLDGSGTARSGSCLPSIKSALVSWLWVVSPTGWKPVRWKYLNYSVVISDNIPFGRIEKAFLSVAAGNVFDIDNGRLNDTPASVAVDDVYRKRNERFSLLIIEISGWSCSFAIG